MKQFQYTSLVFAAMLAATAAQAAPTLLVDRGLPTANLGNAAPAGRSNVSWSAQSDSQFFGDDFKLGGSAGGWNVNSLRTWVVGYQANNDSDLTNDTFLGNFYERVGLYVGDASASKLNRVALAKLAGGNSDASTSPAVKITRVQYAGGVDYDGVNTDWAVYQVDFTGLNLHFASDALVQFGMQLDEMGEGWGAFNHASNAALSGSAQEGADGKFRRFSTDGALDDSATLVGFDCSGAVVPGGCQSSWDKVSDINVQVFGNAVPEPASFALTGLALLALGATRRRRA